MESVDRAQACRLLSFADVVAGLRTVVNAVYSNGTHVKCLIPDPLDPVNLAYKVDLSFNLQDFTSVKVRFG